MYVQNPTYSPITLRYYCLVPTVYTWHAWLGKQAGSYILWDVSDGGRQSVDACHVWFTGRRGRDKWVMDKHIYSCRGGTAAWSGRVQGHTWTESIWSFQTCSVSLSSNHCPCPLVSLLVLLSLSVCLELIDFLYLLMLSYQFHIREKKHPVTPGHISLTSGLCLPWVWVQLAYHRCFLAPAPLSCDGNINIWPDMLPLSLFPARCYGSMKVEDVGIRNPSVSAQAVPPNVKTFTIG